MESFEIEIPKMEHFEVDVRKRNYTTMISNHIH